MRWFALLGLAVGTVACSVLTEDTALVISPGRFDGLRCAELADGYRAALSRERELVAVMARASSDPAGGLVNWLVYSSPLASERGTLRRIQESALLNNCDLQSGQPRE